MQPTKLTVKKDRKALIVAFDTSETYEFSAEILRVLSPSAEVQGHSPEQRKTVHGKEHVQIMTVEPVGNYAIRIGFDDMHNTGIYTWKFFKELGETQDEKWQAYLDDLNSKGLTR